MEQTETLIIAEIYKSIHGELPYQGKIASIVRLAGCLSRCSYCDAKKFWASKGKEFSFVDINKKLRKLGLKSVLITGGEPLHQSGSVNFLKYLVKKGYQVTLETDGTYDLSKIPKQVTIVMDLKTPSSGSSRNTKTLNFKYLKRGDVLKVVVSNKSDYVWATKLITRHIKSINSEVVFSPVYGKLKAKQLLAYMVKDNSNFKMQIQLHKYLGLK